MIDTIDTVARRPPLSTEVEADGEKARATARRLRGAGLKVVHAAVAIECTGRHGSDEELCDNGRNVGLTKLIIK